MDKHIVPILIHFSSKPFTFDIVIIVFFSQAYHTLTKSKNPTHFADNEPLYSVANNFQSQLPM